MENKQASDGCVRRVAVSLDPVDPSNLLTTRYRVYTGGIGFLV